MLNLLSFTNWPRYFGLLEFFKKIPPYKVYSSSLEYSNPLLAIQMKNNPEYTPKRRGKLRGSKSRLPSGLQNSNLKAS